MGKIRGRRRSQGLKKQLARDDDPVWDGSPEGATEETTSFPIPPREITVRERKDREGRLVDYFVSMSQNGVELIRADMSHGTPEIHIDDGPPKPTGGPITSFADVQRAFQRDYRVVIEYDAD